MPAFENTLEAAQIAAIHSYLVGRAETKISAGRPANPGGT
jgi:mono/diheme cytochrome c family protein